MGGWTCVRRKSPGTNTIPCSSILLEQLWGMWLWHEHHRETEGMTTSNGPYNRFFWREIGVAYLHNHCMFPERSQYSQLINQFKLMKGVSNSLPSVVELEPCLKGLRNQPQISHIITELEQIVFVQRFKSCLFYYVIL